MVSCRGGINTIMWLGVGEEMIDKEEIKEEALKFYGDPYTDTGIP